MIKLLDQLLQIEILAKWVDMLAADLIEWEDDLPDNMTSETRVVLLQIPERVHLMGRLTKELLENVKTVIKEQEAERSDNADKRSS